MESVQQFLRHTDSNGSSASVQRAAIIHELHNVIRSNRAKLTEAKAVLDTTLILGSTSELLRAYRALIMDDLQRGNEPPQELCMWDDCFKRTLPHFSRHDNDMYNKFVEYGIRFYEGLIRDIGLHFDVPFIRNAPRGISGTIAAGRAMFQSSPSREPVCFMLQKCLIRIGDLLRYKERFLEAMMIYDKAVYLNPRCGHPFHEMGNTQILINCNTIDGFLAAIYYFARAVTVSDPFFAAQRSLDDLIAKVRCLNPSTKAEEFIRNFLIAVGNPKFDVSVSSFVTMLSPLLTTDSINTNQLFRIIVISLWAWRRECTGAQAGSDATGKKVVLEIIIALFNSLLIAADAHVDLANYYALSHVKILMEWIHINLVIINADAFREKVNTGMLCKFINRLLDLEDNYRHVRGGEMEKVVLPEEKKLFGFLPFRQFYEHLNRLMEETDARVTWVRVYRTLKCVDCFTNGKLGLIQRNAATGDFQEILPEPTYASRQRPSPLFPSSSTVPTAYEIKKLFDQLGSDSFYPYSSTPRMGSVASEIEPGLPVSSQTSNVNVSDNVVMNPPPPLPYKASHGLRFGTREDDLIGEDGFGSTIMPSAGVIGRRVSDGSFPSLGSTTGSEVSTPDTDYADYPFHAFKEGRTGVISPLFHSIWTPMQDDHIERTGAAKWD